MIVHYKFCYFLLSFFSDWQDYYIFLILCLFLTFLYSHTFSFLFLFLLFLSLFLLLLLFPFLIFSRQVRLGLWLKKQRQMYRNNSLRVDRKERLQVLVDRYTTLHYIARNYIAWCCFVRCCLLSRAKYYSVE